MCTYTYRGFYYFLSTSHWHGGCCNHVVDLLYVLDHWLLLGLKEISTYKTCTSLPQLWHQPRGAHILPEPAMSCCFVQASNDWDGQRKCKLSCQVKTAGVRSLESRGGFANDSKGQKFCRFWADQEAPAHKLINKVFGNVPIGCILSYHLKELK